MQEPQVKQLNGRELAAWRGFLRVHAGLVRELDRELELAHGLPLTHYEVLLHLEGAPARKLRMSELAESVLLSQSGVTRLVDRMEQAGLVARERCSDDRRVLYARLTEEGATVLQAVRPTHLAGIRRTFLAHLSDEELVALSDVWERISPGAST